MEKKELIYEFIDYITKHKEDIVDKIEKDNLFLDNKYNPEWIYEGLKQIKYNNIKINKNKKRLIIYFGLPLDTIYYLIRNILTEEYLILSTEGAFSNFNSYVINMYLNILKDNKVLYKEFHINKELDKMKEIADIIENYKK